MLRYLFPKIMLLVTLLPILSSAASPMAVARPDQLLAVNDFRKFDMLMRPLIEPMYWRGMNGRSLPIRMRPNKHTSLRA